MMGTGEVAPRTSVLADARRAFHADLWAQGLLGLNAKGVPNMSDGHNQVSVFLGEKLIEALGSSAGGTRLGGQSSGNRFETCVRTFLASTFPQLAPLRYGRFSVERGKSIQHYEQYEHLGRIDKISKQPGNEELRLVLGSNYLVRPDIVIARTAEADEMLNANGFLVDPVVGRRSSIRLQTGRRPILHASISCKWTMRSDRAQNARTEALNMIRNRKGRLPHITVVTAEADPAIVASLALGTADIDCVYHIALDELAAAIDMLPSANKARMLFGDMVRGHRLRDIADLPLDLTV